MPPHRSPVFRAAATLLTAAMVLGSGSIASADTRSKISAAGKRLNTLIAQINHKQSRVDSMQARMKALTVKIAQDDALYQIARNQEVQSRAQLEEVRGRYDVLRDRFDALARAAYMGTFTSDFEPFADSDYFASTADRVEYVQVVGESDSHLLKDVESERKTLAARERAQSALLARRGEALATLTSEQDTLTKSFADEQGRLAGLASARAQVATLLATLHNQLRAEEIAAAERLAAHGTPLSFGKWAAIFLQTLRAPASRNNLVVMVAWQTAEYTTARWNPLATTYPMPGATTFNGARVRNYRSLQQGLQATMLTLAAQGYGYQAITTSLKQNRPSRETARAINASSWCHGCANGRYVIGLIPAVEAYYNRYANART